jgi:hypothetical protein
MLNNFEKQIEVYQCREGSKFEFKGRISSGIQSQGFLLSRNCRPTRITLM